MLASNAKGPKKPVKNLLEIAARPGWSIDGDIDWDQDIRLPFWIRRKTYLKIVSQFYHGERMIQRLCRRLISEVIEPDAREFLAFQLADEEKHERVYRRYIERIGPIAGLEPELAQALDTSLGWRGSPVALITAFHIVFEGGAMRILDKLAGGFRCPLLAQINTLVCREEALHVAFGVKYVQQHLPDMDAGEVREIGRWVGSVWQECASQVRRRQTLPVRLATRMGTNWAGDAWSHQERLLWRMGLDASEPAASGNPAGR